MKIQPQASHSLIFFGGFVHIELKIGPPQALLNLCSQYQKKQEETRTVMMLMIFA